jgi:hypothetical protein
MKNILIPILIIYILLNSCSENSSKSWKDKYANPHKLQIEVKREFERTIVFHFLNISDKPIFDLRQKTRNEIISELSQMKISIDDKTKLFTVENHCSFEYVLKTTSLSKYYGNDKTIEIYKKEFANKNIIFDENNLIVYQSLYPEKDCQHPASEFIKVNEMLIFVYQGYLIFLKEGNDKFNETFSKIKDEEINCYKKQGNNDYTSTEICEFKKVNNRDQLYDHLRIHFDLDNLLKRLPTKDTIYSIENTCKIYYKIKKDTVGIKEIFDGGINEYKIYYSKHQGVIEVIKSPD